LIYYNPSSENELRLLIVRHHGCESLEVLVARIDLHATIEQVDFPEQVWKWLDLLGEMLVATHTETLTHESYLANDSFKKLMVVGVNRMLRTLNSIYLLLRCEYIDLAAAQVRILCETLITLVFVARDKAVLAPKFWGYYTIEAFETAAAMMELERERAKPEHLHSMETWLDQQRPEYERLKPTYSYVVSKGKNMGKSQPYINWCNRNLAQQAQDCGGELNRLYRLVYKQMSSYVHCSAFSLRHQTAYSRGHYDGRIVHHDIATLVRTTAAVWVEMCKFLAGELEWNLIGPANAVAKEVEMLDQTQFGKGK
jgi:hypothetical protein